MISLSELRYMALDAYRDTGSEMAWAFLKALGVKAPPRRPRRGEVVSAERYRDLEECFRNRRSAEDARAFAFGA